MKIVSAGTLLDQLDGATIVTTDVSDEEGMHFYLQDGRILVIAGVFAVSILQQDDERLH